MSVIGKIGEIRRSSVYHILVGTELRRVIKNFINRKFLQPLQKSSTPVLLGPNGIEVGVFNLPITALGPNGSSEKNTPSTPSTIESKKVETNKFDDLIKATNEILRKTKDLELEINKYLKTGSGKFGLSAVVGGGAALLGFFFPLKGSILVLSPLSFVGSSSLALLAGVVIPNFVAGFAVTALLYHLYAKAEQSFVLREKISMENEVRLAWILAQKIPSESKVAKIPKPLRKLLDEFTKSNENRALLYLARKINNERGLKEDEKFALFVALTSQIVEDKKEIVIKFLENIKSRVQQEEIKTEIEKKIKSLRQSLSSSPTIATPSSDATSKENVPYIQRDGVPAEPKKKRTDTNVISQSDRSRVNETPTSVSPGAKPYDINNLQSVIGYLGKVQQDLLLKEMMTQEELQDIYQNLQEIFSKYPELQDLYAGPLQTKIIDRISKGGKL